MITKLELLKAVCKNSGVTRRNANRKYLTKEELMLLLSKNQSQLVYDYFHVESRKNDLKKD